jgi:hypothetical protein
MFILLRSYQKNYNHTKFIDSIEIVFTKQGKINARKLAIEAANDNEKLLLLSKDWGNKFNDT